MVGTFLVPHSFVGKVWKKKCNWKVWNASGVYVPRKVDVFCVFQIYFIIIIIIII
jgi:hypothetical protein